MKDEDLITKRTKAVDRYWCTECDRRHKVDSTAGKDHVEFRQDVMEECGHPIQYRNAVGHCVLCEARYEPRTGNWREKGDRHKAPCAHNYGKDPKGLCANCGAELERE